MDKIREIVFPKLVLKGQDKSDRYGYHWVEVKHYDYDWHVQKCVLLKEEDGYGYYLPLKPPYEICREHNYPEESLVHYVVTNNESDYDALKKFVPDGVFMPSMDFCNHITAEEWFNAYIAIVTEFPEKICNIAEFDFLTKSDDSIYEGYYLECHPFVNMIKNEGNISYKDDRTWVVKDTHSIKFGEEYKNHVGNVYFYRKEYMEDWYSCRILPVIRIKES